MGSGNVRRLIPVTATAIEPNKRIVVEWPGYDGLTTVEWTFASNSWRTTSD